MSETSRIHSRPAVPPLLLALLVLLPAVAVGQTGGRLRPSDNTVIQPVAPKLCALLDNPAKRDLMDGLLFNLIWACGRQDEFLGVGGTIGGTEAPITAVNDVQVNNSTGETGPSVTQSETSIAQSLATGTLCSSYNDSGEFFGGGGGGLTGFARSTDGAATWTDNGAVGGVSRGDPSAVWRQADGFFYLATLHSNGGLAVWRSTDDCQSFSFLSQPSTGGDDKELLAVDNNPSSPFYGNIYIVWTDFGVGGAPIRASRSTNGGVSWSAPVNVSSGGIVQGAWPTVAPSGDVFVAWLDYVNFQNGPISIRVSRSTNGGVSYAPVTSPLVNAVSPRQAAASSACGRPSLNGNIRYLASPQIAADVGGNLHVVYSYDPDGFNVGDVVNVYYRRSTDNGATWGPEIQLNDDASTNDQYFPTIEVGFERTIMATWYDRREDGGNLLQDYFKRVSTDDGVTWHPSAKLTDVSSPIVLNPSLATCYHGDYDQSVIRAKRLQVAQWADDRNGDPDVWTERGNCSQGLDGGNWFIPTAGSQAFSGVVRGVLASDPTLWNLSGTATTGGTVFGILTAVNPDTPNLAFAGTWQFNPGSTTQGTWSAAITPSALSNQVIGKIGASWTQVNPSQPGSHRGAWKICLQ